MQSTLYGYIRVSTREQNEARQLIALREQGIPAQNILMDKQSGKDFQRPGSRRLCRRMKPGDILFIKSIDRLGRNYREILEQWRYLTKEKKIAVVVLDMPLLDTRVGRDLTGELIADIVLQLLSYVAETERAFIHQRQAEGIAAAKERGVRFGRPPKKRPGTYAAVLRRWQAGEISARSAARELGTSHQTFLNWVRADAREAAEGSAQLFPDGPGAAVDQIHRHDHRADEIQPVGEGGLRGQGNA